MQMLLRIILKIHSINKKNYEITLYDNDYSSSYFLWKLNGQEFSPAEVWQSRLGWATEPQRYN